MKKLMHISEISDIAGLTYIAPSLLSANFLHLERDIKMISNASADWLHLDIMDGHFVPNISYGPMIVGQIRKASDLYLDAHLMIEYPESYLEAFKRSGADLVTVHVEAEGVSPETLMRIKALGMDAGISLNPETPVDALDPYYAFADLILIMSVHPGFGGQKFIPESLAKTAHVAKVIMANHRPTLIQIDGGIGVENAKITRQAGSQVLVAGSSIFNAIDPAIALNKIRQEASGSLAGSGAF
jgi:ribulose-phosphate 3-epimerase